MSFTPGVDSNKINRMLDKYDNDEEIKKIIFSDEFFESKEDKEANIFIASALVKIMAFCADNYYGEDQCSKSCPVDCVLTENHRYDRIFRCTLCKKSSGKNYDKNMTREKVYKAFYSIFFNLEDECCPKCHICRCPFYVATGAFTCEEQLQGGIIYDY